MDKNILIQKLFQKSHLLKITNPQYKKIVDALFNWLTTCDQVKNDQTSKLLTHLEGGSPELVEGHDSFQVDARIRSHQDIVIAGVEEVEWFLKKYPQISFQKRVAEGKTVKKGEEIAVISGNSRTILSLERTILNILQRMSGIATQTQKFAQILNPIHIAATRKTPWMLLDKKAVAVGGGLTHRLDLSDGILIKDNHLQIIKNEYKLKNEEAAVTRAFQMIEVLLPGGGLNAVKEPACLTGVSRLSPPTGGGSHDSWKVDFLEIEVNTKESANAAIKAFSQIQNKNYLIIMLDNWEVKDAKNFIKKINANPVTSSIIFEASGNINENNLKDWAQTGVDIISSGSLTHSVKAADLSLSII